MSAFPERKTMKKLLFVTAAFALLSGAAGAAPGHKAKSMPMSSGSSMTMAAMTANLSGKTGDSFDKTFLSEMMAHHRGAISMAQLALTHAKHPQVKALAKSIISSQMKEVAEMQKWQKEWGYGRP